MLFMWLEIHIKIFYIECAEGVDIRLLNNEVALMPFYSLVVMLVSRWQFSVCFFAYSFPFIPLRGNIDVHFESIQNSFPNSCIYRMIKKYQKVLHRIKRGMVA